MYFDEKKADQSWMEQVDKVERAKPEGQLDEWNEEIQNLNKNKRFHKRFEVENLCKNKRRMLNDNDYDYDKVAVEPVREGNINWGGEFKENLVFNKKKNFFSEYENAVNNNGVFRNEPGFEREIRNE